MTSAQGMTTAQIIMSLIVPLITGGFILLGVWLGQRGAAAAVKRTFEGQKTLARDAALRDYRKQQTAPYPEAAKQRIRIWTEMFAEVGVDDRGKILELQAKVTDAYFNSLVVTYLEISDDSFRAAFQRFVDAEGNVKSAYTKGKSWTRLSKCVSLWVSYLKHQSTIFWRTLKGREPLG